MKLPENLSLPMVADVLADLGVPMDRGNVGRALQAAADVCAADPGVGAAGREALGSRFRWLTAPRSTVVQTGPVHTGLTADPDALEDLRSRVLARSRQAGSAAPAPSTRNMAASLSAWKSQTMSRASRPSAASTTSTVRLCPWGNRQAPGCLLSMWPLSTVKLLAMRKGMADFLDFRLRWKVDGGRWTVDGGR